MEQGSKTCATHLEELRDSFQVLFDGLRAERPSTPHILGAVNVATHEHHFRTTIAHVDSLLRKYQSLASSDSSAGRVLKRKMKECTEAETKSKHLRTILEDCQALGRKRCAGEMSAGPDVMAGAAHLVKSLEATAQDLKLHFHMARSTASEAASGAVKKYGATATLSCNSFLVDLYLSPMGEVTSVAVQRCIDEKADMDSTTEGQPRTTELEPEGVAQLRQGHLKSGMLMQHLRRLADQEQTLALDEQNRATLTQALVTLESDLVKISELEAGSQEDSNKTIQQQLLEGHGLLRHGFGIIM